MDEVRRDRNLDHSETRWCRRPGHAGRGADAETGDPFVGLDPDDAEAGMRIGVFPVANRFVPGPAVTFARDVGYAHRV